MGCVWFIHVQDRSYPIGGNVVVKTLVKRKLSLIQFEYAESSQGFKGFLFFYGVGNDHFYSIGRLVWAVQLCN